MSSEEQGGMSKEGDKKPGLVPRLRFPEFRTQRPWELKELAQVLTSISNGISLPQNSSGLGLRVTRIETISEGVIDLDRVGYVDALKEELEECRLNVGDLLFSNINSLAHIGKSVFVDADYDLYHGMNLLRLRVDAKSSYPKFIYFLVNTPDFRSSICQRANKAVNQASINQTELGRTVIPLPSLAEQQKIFDCLSSLDEKIAAETQKLGALKTHKKGLMQQLFPAEGETLPRLRFPEFREAGGWCVRHLGDICNLYQPETISSSSFAADGQFLVYGAGGVIGRTDRFNHEHPEVIIGCRGICGNTTLTQPKSWITGNSMVIHPKSTNLLKEFLFQFLDTADFSPIISGSAQPQITRQGLKRFNISFPATDEQQKIADCLSSLDDLIAAQTQKIAALKQHKKGLMQQLFPVLDEVGA
jgi:type I restriction enzyme S subunit